jgi:hypothetical protein
VGWITENVPAGRTFFLETSLRSFLEVSAGEQQSCDFDHLTRHINYLLLRD